MANLADSLENRIGRYIPNNLTLYLVIGQVLGFLVAFQNPDRLPLLSLSGIFVLRGQVWRLFTFLFYPVDMSPLFAALTWYLYYIYGTALEREWGSFRYAVYLGVGVVTTIAAAFLFPDVEMTAGYLFASLFLAFARLFPDFRLYLFFILPVKVKWISWLIWLSIAVSVVLGSPSARILAIVSVFNYLLFFGRDIVLSARYGTKKAAAVAVPEKTYMKCAYCGKTEKDKKIFYYCHICSPETCYCEDHIHDHKHLGHIVH